MVANHGENWELIANKIKGTIYAYKQEEDPNR